MRSYRRLFRLQGLDATPTTHGAITTGETVRMDIQLRRGLELKGRVVDEKGKPIAGAVVINLTSFPIPERVVTDEQGNFVLTNIAPLKEIRLRAYSGDLRTRNDVVVFAGKPEAKRIELKVLKGQKTHC